MHKEYEINFIENGKGVRRIVGDSIEETADYDLVLIGSENLEHVWEQGSCVSEDIREITIQFSPKLFEDSILSKNQFSSIKKMLDDAKRGIAFPMPAIMKIYSLLDGLPTETDGFVQFIHFMLILYHLSQFDYHTLSSTSFSHVAIDEESRRIKKVKEYINSHLTEDITLDTLADLVSMSPTSFSRFFKQSAHKTLSSYIIDIKLGNATRALLDTTKNVSEICYESGFNNLSNFNRIFKAKKGMTPKEFRALYKKIKVIV